jgi:CDK inhibitor PHO81
MVLHQILPLELGLSIELAYPSAALRAQLYLSRSHDLNTFVDAVLSTVYSSLAELTSSKERQSIGREPQRRKLVFSSFAPDVCAALNWKQPNCMCLFLFW